MGASFLRIAFVAQWIEHLTSDQTVGSSSLSGRTNSLVVLVAGMRDFPRLFATRRPKVPLSQIFLTCVKVCVSVLSQEEKWRDVKLVRPKFGWHSDYL